MTKKDLAGKLAQGVRRAKQPSSVPAAVTPNPVTPGAAGAARQAGQSPRACLDRPWENLHPERIWPD
jgi:hypothetical protein